jgi:hypothetical protein
MPLPNPQRRAPTEGAELPDAPTLDRLSPVQRQVAALIAAGASDRDIERQTRVHRFYALPQVREQIKQILSDFVVPDTDATEPPPAAYRQAILQDAARQLA